MSTSGDGFELSTWIQDLRDKNVSLGTEHDPTEEDINDLIETAVERVAESSDAISEPDVFDVYCSVLKHSAAVSGSIMSKLLDSVMSGMRAQRDSLHKSIVESEDNSACLEHREPIERYAFLLQWFLTAAEAVKKSEGDSTPAPKKGRATKTAAAFRKDEHWSWAEHIPTLLQDIDRVLQTKTHRTWVSTLDRDAFITCLMAPVYHVVEVEANMKTGTIRTAVYQSICHAVKSQGHGTAAGTRIIQLIQYHEHLAEPMADCLAKLVDEYDTSQLPEELLREIAKTAFGGQDKKSPREFAKFLIQFGKICPAITLRQLPLLLEQLDSDSYNLRIAIVEILGTLILHLCPINPEEDINEAVTKQTEGLTKLLLQRLLDNSAYVRAKDLSVITRLCPRVPKTLRLPVTRAAIECMYDKVTTVRKGAISLMIYIILNHPYDQLGGHLSRKKWTECQDAFKARLRAIEGEIGISADREEEDEEEAAPKKKDKKSKKSRKPKGEDEDSMDVDDEGEDEDEDESDPDTEPDVDMDAPVAGPSRPKLGPRKSTINVRDLDVEAAHAAANSQEAEKLRMQIHTTAEALEFIGLLEDSVSVICELLGSKNKAEVLESMEFFRVAQEYQLSNAMVGVKKMLHLIWSKDNGSTTEDGEKLKGIRARLLECYRSLYFEPPDAIAGKRVDVVTWTAENLITLTYDATLADLISLEEMMRVMTEDRQIEADIVNRLWNVYANGTLGYSKPIEQRRGAINILAMMAIAKRSVVTEHIDTMLGIGLGKPGKADLTLARYTCVALQRLNGSAKKVKGSLDDKTLRLPMDSMIFRKLQDALEAPCRNKEWFGLAEQGINTIYALGDHPDKLCNELIKALTIRAMTKKAQPECDPDAMDEDEPSGSVGPNSEGPLSSQVAASQPGSEKHMADNFALSQLLFVVGHVALKQVVFLELVEREWKRQKDEKFTAEKLDVRPEAIPKDIDELDAVVGNAEDEIGETIQNIRETELLYGDTSLLALYGSLLVNVCGSPHKFKNKILRAAATLSFSKFLCVSPKFCETHHALLFKLLETSRDADVRSNIVIALGDVAVSFSTIIDENSYELYRGLSDKDPVVKKNTLMVLTHLILTGMIKVKGQLGEMAKCLDDPDQRISDLAKLFFTELSGKDNIIYNNLPDVISHLSTGPHSVDEPAFQSTMKYIFAFIEKEKQAEAIVEKLCQRFHLSEDPRQWRDVAFCLSLLPFKSERSVKKLIEGLQFYRDKLHEGTVFLRFSEILAKARLNKSANKPDTELAEFEAILEEHRARGEEDQGVEQRAAKKKQRAAKKGKGKAAASTRKSSRKKAPVDEQDEGEFEED